MGENQWYVVRGVSQGTYRGATVWREFMLVSGVYVSLRNILSHAGTIKVKRSLVAQDVRKAAQGIAVNEGSSVSYRYRGLVYLGRNAVLIWRLEDACKIINEDRIEAVAAEQKMGIYRYDRT